MRDVLDDIARKNAASAQHGYLPVADVEQWLQGTRELELECEAFRSCFYPRRHEVFVALCAVSTISKAGRSVQIVFDGAVSHDGVSR